MTLSVGRYCLMRPATIIGWINHLGLSPNATKLYMGLFDNEQTAWDRVFIPCSSEQRGRTIKEMAQWVGCSPRSLRLALQELRDAGVLIESEAGISYAPRIKCYSSLAPSSRNGAVMQEAATAVAAIPA